MTHDVFFFLQREVGGWWGVETARAVAADDVCACTIPGEKSAFLSTHSGCRCATPDTRHPTSDTRAALQHTHTLTVFQSDPQRRESCGGSSVVPWDFLAMMLLSPCTREPPTTRSTAPPEGSSAATPHDANATAATAAAKKATLVLRRDMVRGGTMVLAASKCFCQRAKKSSSSRRRDVVVVNFGRLFVCSRFVFDLFQVLEVPGVYQVGLAVLLEVSDFQHFHFIITSAPAQAAPRRLRVPFPYEKNRS